MPDVKPTSEEIILDGHVEIGRPMEELLKYGELIGLTTVAGSKTEADAAAKIITFIDQMPDDDWKAMDIAVKNWSNELNANILEKRKELNEAAAKAKKTAAKKPPAAKKTPKAQTASTVGSVEGEINECKTKADIIANATSLAKKLGKKIKLVKGWTVAKLKEEAIKQLNAEEEPSPKRIAGNAGAPDPSASAVGAAKDKAKKTAAAAKAKTGNRGIEEGEHFRRGTTAWLVWDVFNRAKNPLTIEVAKERFLKDFEKSGLNSKNPEGRLPRIVQVMVHDKKIMKRNEDGTYELIS